MFLIRYGGGKNFQKKKNTREHADGKKMKDTETWILDPELEFKNVVAYL